MKFKQKEHIIEAVQWNGSNRAEICDVLKMPSGELFYYKQLQLRHCGELVVVKPGDFVCLHGDGKTVLIYSQEHMKQYYEPLEQEKQITIKPRTGKTSRVERMFGPKEKWGAGAESTQKEPEQPEEITMEDVVKSVERPKPKRPKGYAGFLYLRCEHCGKEKGMCIKKPLEVYRCGCGHETKLEKLKRVEFTCGCCGTGFQYLTNMTCLGFTMDCLSCKAPVDLQYNQRARKYEGGGTE